MKKKFSIFLIAILIGFTSLMTVGCGETKEVIRLNEVTHSIFYAPLYVAINNGYFEDEGYTIELTNGGGSDASMTALLSGSADIALMGPETNVYVINQGKTDYPVIFGQLTKRDGSFLISRENETNFDWSNLQGKHIIAGRKGGSPAMSLQYALEKNGYDISTDLNFDLSIAFNMTVPAFENGTGDYVTMFEPAASDYVAAGKGYIVASVGEESGEIPFTSFSANKSFLEKEPEKIIRFLKAVQRGYEYLVTANIDDVVNSLMPSFNGSDKVSIKSAIQNYISIDAWNETPFMKESSFDRLQESMISAGEITKKVKYADAVNNNFATFVLNEYFA